MIIVCPLHSVHQLVEVHTASHVISLLAEDGEHPAIEAIDDDHHLKLSFHDIAWEMEGMSPPRPHHVERIIEFGRAWPRRQPMVVHCWAGISRSTAAAFTLMCALNPDRDETELARELRQLSPSATPNPLMVSYGDDLLGRNGRMNDAVAAIGRGAMAFEGHIFAWPVDGM